MAEAPRENLSPRIEVAGKVSYPRNSQHHWSIMTVTESELLEAVVAVIRELASDGVLPHDLATAPIGQGSSLESLALDSMGRMDLLSAVDERLGIYIPEDKLSPAMNLAQFAALLSQRQ
jgi:acyl carrier protein